MRLLLYSQQPCISFVEAEQSLDQPNSNSKQQRNVKTLTSDNIVCAIVYNMVRLCI